MVVAEPDACIEKFSDEVLDGLLGPLDELVSDSGEAKQRADFFLGDGRPFSARGVVVKDLID